VLVDDLRHLRDRDGDAVARDDDDVAEPAKIAPLAGDGAGDDLDLVDAVAQSGDGNAGDGHAQPCGDVLRREAELAAGHSEVRLAGFITVSGRDRDELRRASSEVLEHAARARLELHRLYGQQAEAFTFTLPLCRGLR